MYPHDIFTVTQFKAATSVWGGIRHSMWSIDAALGQYHLIPKHNIESRRTQLKVLQALCKTFIEDTEAQYRIAHPHRHIRKDGVTRLHEQIRLKREYLKLVIGIETSQSDLLIAPLDKLTPTQRFRRLALAIKRFGDPSHVRTLRSDYWGEIVDPLHRPLNKPENRVLYERWLDERYGVQPVTTLSFYRWLEGQDVSGMVESRYQDDEQRKQFRVFAIDARLCHDSEGRLPATTLNNSTNFSGKGWAIFALSRGGMLYAGTHDNGEHGFFHSCFLSGAPVASAGELKIRNGALHSVSAKSGHYKPGVREICNLLGWMSDHGIPIADATVQWQARMPDGRLKVLRNQFHQFIWYPATQFLANNGNLDLCVPLAVELAHSSAMTSRIVFDSRKGGDIDNLANYVPSFNAEREFGWINRLL